MMRFISRKFHAVLDYLSAAVLIAAPWLLHFDDSAYATYTAVIAGGLILVLSLFTRYEGGLIRKVSMWTHLAFDVTLGAVLAASPWMLKFSDSVYLPHLIMGLLAIGAGFMTKGESLKKRNNNPNYYN